MTGSTFNHPKPSEKFTHSDPSSASNSSSLTYGPSSFLCWNLHCWVNAHSCWKKSDCIFQLFLCGISNFSCFSSCFSSCLVWNLHVFPASDSGASPAARRHAHLPVSLRGVPAPGSGVPRGRATAPRLGRAPASAKSPVMDRLFGAPWMFAIIDITDICKHVFSSKLMELISVIDWSDFRGSSFMLLSVLSYEGLMRLPSWRSTCSYFFGYLIRHIAK